MPFILIFGACQSDNEMKIIIDKIVELEAVPSASGIEWIDSSFWIIGDNSPFLFKINEDYEIEKAYEIGDVSKLEKKVLNKANKADLEAMTRIEIDGEPGVFVFGSGSKDKLRNVGQFIDLKGVVRNQFDLTLLYELLRDEAKLHEKDFNIEAATIYDKHLFLFNRGKNKVITMKTDDFIDFLFLKKEEFKVKVHTIDLPEINNVEAGFSGATSDEVNGRILFTASVENTSDWVEDGEVYGSFVGSIIPELLTDHYLPETVEIMQENEILRIKVESITILNSTSKTTKCALITDSDGSISELLKITIVN